MRSLLLRRPDDPVDQRGREPAPVRRRPLPPAPGRSLSTPRPSWPRSGTPWPRGGTGGYPAMSTLEALAVGLGRSRSVRSHLLRATHAARPDSTISFAIRWSCPVTPSSASTTRRATSTRAKRPARPEEAEVLDRVLDLDLAAHARRVDDPQAPLLVECEGRSRSGRAWSPGRESTMDRSSSSRRFRIEDLPTFGRPTMATDRPCLSLDRRTLR